MYDEDISRRRPRQNGRGPVLPLALADLTRAADLFQPVFARTDGVDGWVSLEVSPLLAHDTKSTLAAALDLHKRAGKPNLFIKIPGTAEGLPAIEEAILPACRSTSHCCSLANNTSRRPTRTCAASNGGSRRG